MPSDLPPLPWSYEVQGGISQRDGAGIVYLLDANGRKIGTLWGKADEKLASARMIVEASEREAERETAAGVSSEDEGHS